MAAPLRRHTQQLSSTGMWVAREQNKHKIHNGKPEQRATSTERHMPAPRHAALTKATPSPPHRHCTPCSVADAPAARREQPVTGVRCGRVDQCHVSISCACAAMAYIHTAPPASGETDVRHSHRTCARLHPRARRTILALRARASRPPSVSPTRPPGGHRHQPYSLPGSLSAYTVPSPPTSAAASAGSLAGLSTASLAASASTCCLTASASPAPTSSDEP